MHIGHSKTKKTISVMISHTQHAKLKPTTFLLCFVVHASFHSSLPPLIFSLPSFQCRILRGSAQLLPIQTRIVGKYFHVYKQAVGKCALKCSLKCL